jgi:hypothetical protein
MHINQYRAIILGDFNVPTLVTMTRLMAHHFPILITTIKLKDIQFTRPPAFLVLTKAITLS